MYTNGLVKKLCMPRSKWRINNFLMRILLRASGCCFCRYTYQECRCAANFILSGFWWVHELQYVAMATYPPVAKGSNTEPSKLITYFSTIYQPVYMYIIINIAKNIMLCLIIIPRICEGYFSMLWSLCMLLMLLCWVPAVAISCRPVQPVITFMRWYLAADIIIMLHICGTCIIILHTSWLLFICRSSSFVISWQVK